MKVCQPKVPDNAQGTKPELCSRHKAWDVSQHQVLGNAQGVQADALFSAHGMSANIVFQTKCMGRAGDASQNGALQENSEMRPSQATVTVDMRPALMAMGSGHEAFTGNSDSGNYASTKEQWAVDTGP
eukprot:scaffold106066_cov19-Tisochrysis_lutea.AAC.1